MYQSIVNSFKNITNITTVINIVNVANTVVLINCFIMSPLRFALEYQEGVLHVFRARKEREARSSEEIEDYVCFCFKTQKLICENKAQGLNK